ncbi:MAG: hypothetical protein ACR2PG_26875 [Hyphomicrobiaceae bacterium]
MNVSEMPAKGPFEIAADSTSQSVFESEDGQALLVPAELQRYSKGDEGDARAYFTRYKSDQAR